MTIVSAVHSHHLGRGARWVALASLLALHGAAVAQTSAPDDYKLGPGDVVTVTVLRHPEFSGDFLVPSDGYVEFQKVGRLMVTGKTRSNLTTEITDELKKTLRKPEVTVVLKQARPIGTVSVLGNVARAGTYPVQAGWRITEALSAAGGVPIGVKTEDTSVVVVRDGKAFKTFPLNDATANVNGANIVLEANDVVTLNTVQPMSVSVVGKVANQGVYQLREGVAGPVDAVVAAGGASLGAQLTRVKIIHADGKEELVNLAPVILRGEPDRFAPLKPGDMVVVPESRDRIAVLGSVGKPGPIQLPEDQQYTLLDAISQADGTSGNRGRLSRVAVVRKTAGKDGQVVDSRTVYDVGRYLSKGDATQNPVLQPGDVVYVPENNKVQLATVLSAVSVGAVLFRLFN